MHENPSFVVCQTQISKSNAGRGEEEVNGEVVTQTDNYEGKLAGEHTQCCQLTEEAMRWTKKHLGGQAGKSKWQAERERRKSTVDAGRQTSAHRRSISQTESSSNIHMCWCEKQSKPSSPPVEAGLPLKLWRWGEVSRYRELLICRGGGVLTLTSMQPARSSLAQLCQEASKAAPAARFQWYVCLIAWYSKIY